MQEMQRTQGNLAVGRSGWAGQSLSGDCSTELVRREDQRDVLDGLRRCGSVFPLFDGGGRVFRKDGIAAYRFNIGDRAIGKDSRLQADQASHLRVLQNFGVIGFRGENDFTAGSFGVLCQGGRSERRGQAECKRKNSV